MDSPPTPSHIHPNAVIAVLGKAPVAGTVKTRMQPHLSPEQSAHLQANLIDYTLNTCLQSRLAPIQLWCAPNATHVCFQAHAQHVELREQATGNLGVKMRDVFQHNAQADWVILIGTDCPQLTPNDLTHATHALPSADVIIQPAHDGGYVLIGGRNTPKCFENINWGTDGVFEQTTHALQQHNQTYTALRTLSDLDFFDDLNALPNNIKRTLLTPHPLV